jgi:hypothetical protein
MTCECHNINWLAMVRNKDNKYTMTDGTPLRNGVTCQDKVNDGKMDMATYLSVCKYKPGYEGSLFPDEVYQYLLEDTSQEKIDIPLICQYQLEYTSLGSTHS